jgi:hypothetical protein
MIHLFGSLPLARIGVSIFLVATFTGSPALSQQPGSSSVSAQSDVPAYDNLSDLPSTVGYRLPCLKTEPVNCPTRVELKKETIVWGVPLKAGTVVTGRTGILARDTLYRGVWLKGGADIHLYATWSGTLLHDQTFSGVECSGSSSAAFVPDSGRPDSDRLVECTLLRDQTFNGVPCRGGTVAGFFPESNRLARCALHRNQTFAGVACRAGSVVFFDDNGPSNLRVRRCQRPA